MRDDADAVTEGHVHVGTKCRRTYRFTLDALRLNVLPFAMRSCILLTLVRRIVLPPVTVPHIPFRHDDELLVRLVVGSCGRDLLPVARHLQATGGRHDGSVLRVT